MPAVCLNTNFLVVQQFYIISLDIYDFNDEMGSGILIYKMDSRITKPSLYKYIHAEKSEDYDDYSIQIEAGSSPFLLSWSSNCARSSIILLNLETKQQLLHVRLSGEHVPGNWFGGVFTFVKLVDNEFSVRILDPRKYTTPLVNSDDPLSCLEDEGSATFFPGRTYTLECAECMIKFVHVDYMGVISITRPK